MDKTSRGKVEERLVEVASGAANLEGNLNVPEAARGVVLFAHGSGSSRHSPRNRYVASVLNQAGLATLLIDLLTPTEEEVDKETRELRFNITFLAERLITATEWLAQNLDVSNLKIGYFGASTGAGAALVAAAQLAGAVAAVVSRGGRPDLAGSLLPQVQAPTLLIVGGNDTRVIGMNQKALAQLRAEKKLEIVPGATHLFEESGALEEVARLAREWFEHYLVPAKEFQSAHREQSSVVKL
jgi:dienelactone hydrolase